MRVAGGETSMPWCKHRQVFAANLAAPCLGWPGCAPIRDQPGPTGNSIPGHAIRSIDIGDGADVPRPLRPLVGCPGGAPAGRAMTQLPPSKPRARLTVGSGRHSSRWSSAGRSGPFPGRPADSSAGRMTYGGFWRGFPCVPPEPAHCFGAVWREKRKAARARNTRTAKGERDGGVTPDSRHRTDAPRGRALRAWPP